MVRCLDYTSAPHSFEHGNIRSVSSMNEMIFSVGEVTTLYDPQTAASIVSFKTSSSPSRGTAVVKTKHGIGGLILSASDEKPILNVFSFQKVCSGLKDLFSENFIRILISILVDRSKPYIK